MMQPLRSSTLFPYTTLFRSAEDQAIVVEDGRLRGEALRVRGEILERLGRFDEALVVVSDASELFAREGAIGDEMADRKSTRLNSSHLVISYAVVCLKKKKMI